MLASTVLIGLTALAAPSDPVNAPDVSVGVVEVHTKGIPYRTGNAARKVVLRELRLQKIKVPNKAKRIKVKRRCMSKPQCLVREAKKAGVDALVDVDLRKSGSKVKVKIRFIDGSSGEVLVTRQAKYARKRFPQGDHFSPHLVAGVEALVARRAADVRPSEAGTVADAGDRRGSLFSEPGEPLESPPPPAEFAGAMDSEPIATASSETATETKPDAEPAPEPEPEAAPVETTEPTATEVADASPAADPTPMTHAPPMPPTATEPMATEPSADEAAAAYDGPAQLDAEQVIEKAPRERTGLQSFAIVSSWIGVSVGAVLLAGGGATWAMTEFGGVGAGDEETTQILSTLGPGLLAAGASIGLLSGVGLGMMYSRVE